MGFRTLQISAMACMTIAPAFAQTDATRMVNAQGQTTFVSGNLGSLRLRAPFLGGDSTAIRAAAERFMPGLLRAQFGAEGSEGSVPREPFIDELGMVHMRIDQTIHGLPVEGAQLVLHAKADGRVTAVNGDFVSAAGVSAMPTITAEVAIPMAMVELGVDAYRSDQPIELRFVLDADRNARLAWRQLVEYEGRDGIERDFVFADANDGSLAARHPTIHRQKTWRTYTANNGFSLPGSLSCSNNQTCGDTVAQTAHDNLSQTYDFYDQVFGRDSLDDNGFALISTVHYGNNYNNAFWNGSQMAYGDGDGNVFAPLGNALDVAAHELTHGLTTFTSNLIYQNESGALNEAMSDIMGAAVEAWAGGGSVNSNTWKLGEVIYTPNTPGDALRYMNNPTQDGSSRDYYPTRYTGSADSGGVHWNSGIANLAFQLLVDGGTHPLGKTTNNVPGIGMTKARAIFYRTNVVYLTASSNFEAARAASVQAANDLYGASDAAAVHEAWCAVGVPGCPPGGPTNSPPELTTPSNQSNLTGDFVSLAVSADDPDNDPLSFSASGLPQGLGINSNTGVISGTIAASAVTGTATVTVSDGQATDSGSFSWSVSQPPSGYCAASGNNASEEWISRVRIGGLDYSSGSDGGYANRSSISTNVPRSQAIAVNLTPAYSGQSWPERWRVFIDYNQDNDFDDAGETVYTSPSNSTSTVSGSFTVPATAPLGTTRMRVVMRYNAAPSACGTFNYGEVEDYSINIEQGQINYCSASGNNASEEWIARVAIGGIDQTSGSDGGYVNRTSVGTSLSRGSGTTVALTPAYSGSTWPEYWRVYVDFNQDGDFTDAGELAYTSGGTSTSTVSGTLSVPSNATLGATRMRVIMRYNAAPASCGSFNYGEVEDYTLTVTN